MSDQSTNVETGLISGDDHMDLCYLPADLWQSRVPARSRDVAPRVELVGGQPMWVREGNRWGIHGSKKALGSKIPFEDVGLAEEVEPGVFRPASPKHRLEDM